MIREDADYVDIISGRLRPIDRKTNRKETKQLYLGGCIYTDTEFSPMKSCASAVTD